MVISLTSFSAKSDRSLYPLSPFIKGFFLFRYFIIHLVSVCVCVCVKYIYALEHVHYMKTVLSYHVTSKTKPENKITNKIIIVYITLLSNTNEQRKRPLINILCLHLSEIKSTYFMMHYCLCFKNIKKQMTVL